jgi:transposase InsO family protein
LPARIAAGAHVVLRWDALANASARVLHEPTVAVSVYPSQLLLVEVLRRPIESTTYASENYQDVLDARGITCSMSRRGNCYDNAAMESWFSTLKSELGERFENNAAAKEQLFDYIEVFYNQQRRRSAIGYVSPAEFEKAARDDLPPENWTESDFRTSLG